MTTDKPIVALVGLPNAGKSTLMNKISGEKFAVTADQSGTTRDRHYIDVTWNGREFTLVDTAGLLGQVSTALEKSVQEQVDIAVSEADLLILVVDGKLEPVTLPQSTLSSLRKTKKPLLLAVNKLDSPKTLTERLTLYARLGVKPAFGVSATTGRGIGDLLDAVIEQLPQAPTPTTADQNRIAVCFAGKPNVGKSSLLNAILKEKRMVVSDVPGTTRTAIEIPFTVGGRDCTFIDTAGLSRKYRQQHPSDRFSSFQTFKAIRKSDVVLFVVEATLPITHQDQAIADFILETDKGCIILVNKFDQYRGSKQALHDYMAEWFPALWMCPVFFVSAETGAGLTEALGAIPGIFDRRHKIARQEELTNLLARQMKTNPPRRLKDQRVPKVHKLEQIATNPPLFQITVNVPAAISLEFRNSLKKRIIKELDFYGTKINIALKAFNR